jgi:lysophospholipase L1-like esterase
MSLTAGSGGLTLIASSGSLTTPILDPEVSAIIARMSSAPPAANSLAIYGLVSTLKLAGIWSRLDSFQVYAAHTSQAALLDWKRSAISATLHGATTPVHYPNNHFYSAGSPAYLNTKFNPAAASQLYAQNDASWGYYHSVGNLSSNYSGAFQGSTTNRVLFVNNTPTIQISANDTADRGGSTVSGYGRNHGLCSVSRTGATTVTSYVRGVSVGTPGSTSSALPNVEMYAFANNINGNPNNYGVGKISAFFAGQSLDTAQMLTLSNALDIYMLQVGGALQKVACWGDSLTAGGLLPYGADWRHQVEQSGATVQAEKPYRWVYNGGVSGESATNIRTRMIADTTYRDNIQIIWAGRNGFYGATATVLAEIATMVAAAQARSGKYLVLSVTNANWEAFPSDPASKGVQGVTPTWEDLGSAPYNDIITINSTLESLYGSNYIDVRTALVNTGTAPEIARGVIPLTALQTNDCVHINNTGAAVVAAQVNARIASLGW